MTIKIYEQEIQDGVAEVVKASASIVYASEISLRSAEDIKKTWQVDFPIKPHNEELLKSLAENQDQKDLYYLESVLVSTGWNKNDDVFLPEATWAARKTPEDKQFNFMHDENDIIGHITGSYVLTKDGQALSSDQETAPEEFDIITQAVLYNSWSEEKNRDRMSKIIAEIQEGKWYVSMECLFSGFDYALIDEKGQAKILTRDESSAFLTKHLRSYGGSGEYQNHKIGRALTNISFSGKGLVSKPANPRSVILNSTKANVDFKPSSKLSIGETSMSNDNSSYKVELEETRQLLKAAQAEVETVRAQIAQAKDKEFEDKIAAYESKIESNKASIEDLNELVKSSQAKVAELEDALAASKDALAKAMKEMDDMKKKEKMQKRKASLLEAGLEEDEVDSTLASLEALDDEAFEALAGMMKKKTAKKHEDMKKMKEMKDYKSGADLNQSDMNIDSSDASLVIPEDQPQDELAKTQASISNWFETQVLNK